MAPIIRVHESDRDQDFGIIRKQIKVYNLPSFETPTKCLKNLYHSFPSTLSINEVTKRIYPETIESIMDGTHVGPRKTIWPRFLRNKLNLTIFELRFDSVPTRDEIKSLASYWYAASEFTLFLPTVKLAMLKEGNIFSDKKMFQYLGMMRYIIEITEAIGNTKSFIGTVPLIPIKYARPLIRLYHEKDITAFAIDGGTKDFLNHETDFRSILIEINEEVPLNKAFIYACNLGIPQFEAYKARADDFLSFFAYVDAFGTTFKTRGGPRMRRTPPRVKKFLRNELSYAYIQGDRRHLRDFNQHEQLKEADTVRTLIGKEKMQTYLNGKSAVDSFAKRRLDSIARNVQIS